MGQALGLLTMGVQLGVEAIMVKPKRAIGPFVAQVTLRETHTDDLEITEHPVELGAAISDHAYKKPAEVVIECAWSNSPQNPGLINGLLGAISGTLDGLGSILSGSSPDQVRSLYEQLLALQESRVPFDVYTAKRTYQNMLLKTLATTTDRSTENMLSVTATLRQVLIARTQIISVTTAPIEDMAIPQSTAPVLDKGVKQISEGLSTFNPLAGAKSLLSSNVASIASQARGALASASGGVSEQIAGLFF